MSEILFFTAGKIDFASSRYRGYWPAKYMPSVEVHPLEYALQSGVPFRGDTKTIIFQKYWYAPTMKYAQDHGYKVIWDVCDPSWWFTPEDCREALKYADIVTASTQEVLDDLIEQYSDMVIDGVVIPDAFNLDHYRDADNYGREYDGKTINLVWYGHENNRFTLISHLAELQRLVHVNKKIVNLTILDGAGGNDFYDPTINIKHVPWSLDKEVEVIASHNLAFLPSYPGMWGKLKSDNKQVHAGLCNVLVYDPAKPRAPLLKMLEWGRDEIDEGWLKLHDARVVAEQWLEVAS